MTKKKEAGILKPIDVKQLFRDKNPRMAKVLPGFVYYFLKRILHLEFINSFLEKHGHKRGLEFTEAAIKEFNVSLEIRGAGNLPPEGRFLFVSNHPLGGFDGILLVDYLGRKYGKLNVLVNDILMNIKTMDEIFIPINKHGKQSLESAREIEKVFSSSNQVLTFPAGLVSRKNKGVIRDPEWKKNFITKAVRHQRDIIPVHVSGRCTNFFYLMARLRKIAGIKSNIEMFLLPDETYRHRNEHIIITFGYPVKWQIFDKRFRPETWAKKLQDHVYSLSDGEMKTFEYDY